MPQEKRGLDPIDGFTREGPAIRVSRKRQSSDVIGVLADRFILSGVPARIRSDNGPELIASAVRDWIAAVGAKTARIEPGSLRDGQEDEATARGTVSPTTGCWESFSSRLRDEPLDRRTAARHAGAVAEMGQGGRHEAQVERRDGAFPVRQQGRALGPTLGRGGRAQGEPGAARFAVATVRPIPEIGRGVWRSARARAACDMPANATEAASEDPTPAIMSLKAPLETPVPLLATSPAAGIAIARRACLEACRSRRQIDQTTAITGGRQTVRNRCP